MLFLAEAPTLFILFILSHGNANGIIYTDHVGSDEFFTEKSVSDALKKNEFLKGVVKLLFLQVGFKCYYYSLFYKRTITFIIFCLILNPIYKYISMQFFNIFYETFDF
jgi:hypothetical protein